MTDKVKVKARSSAITRRFEINSSSSWNDLELQVSGYLRNSFASKANNPRFPVTSLDFDLKTSRLDFS